VRATPGSRWYVSSTLQKHPAANCASARPSPAAASVSGSRAGFGAPSAAAAELDMATMLVAAGRPALRESWAKIAACFSPRAGAAVIDRLALIASSYRRFCWYSVAFVRILLWLRLSSFGACFIVD